MVAPLIIVRNSFVQGRRANEDCVVRNRRIAAAIQYATAYMLTSDRHGLVRLGSETRTLFDRRTDDILLAVARARLLAHVGERAAFHRLTLSLHPSLGLEVAADVPRWTRGTLTKGCAWLKTDGAEWVAAVHRDAARVHVHVVLGGCDGRGRDLILRPAFFAYLRQAGCAEADAMQCVKVEHLHRLVAGTWP